MAKSAVPPTADPAVNVRKPAASGSATRAVGNETKADMKGALGSDNRHSGGVMAGDSGLSGAVKHLQSEHPIPYSDHGPHHGTDHHKTHMPLHGLKPTAGK